MSFPDILCALICRPFRRYIVRASLHLGGDRLLLHLEVVSVLALALAWQEQAFLPPVWNV